jgi:Tfp pilus assembly protein PilO
MAVGIATITLLLIASWMLLISPLLSETSDVKDSVSAAQDRNQVMATQVAAIKAQQRNLSSYQAVADQLETLFPPTADQPGFFAAVTQAAAGAGIPADKVTTLSPSAPQLLDPTGQPIPADAAAGDDAATTADVAQQTVSVTAEGTYGQIQHLLANLEEMERAFEVTSLDVTGATSTEGSTAGPGTLTVSITGSTYVASPLTMAEPEDKSSTSAAG